MPKNTLTSHAFLSGNEAFAQGLYEAGLKVACAYPGTPSTEIVEYLSQFSEIDSQWSVNEKVAFEVALAASIGGLRSLYSGKHVGLNVAMDPLMTAAYTGVGAGFIIVTADDPGLHSSQNEQDNRLIARFAKVPLLEPVSPQDAKYIAPLALNLSEEFDTPVIVRFTTRISHSKENVCMGTRTEVPLKPFTINIPKYVMVPRNAYARHEVLEEKLLRLAAYAEKTPLNRIERGDTRIGIITSSVSYLYAKEMYPDASFLRLGMSFPFPEKKVRAFAESVKQVYVIEELEPFLEEQVRLAGVRVKTKHPSFRIGELRPELIPQIIAGEEKKEEKKPARKPVLCAGCPHRATYAVLRKHKILVTGDIGCYTLGAAPPLASLHTCVCMGASITFLEGMKKGVTDKPVVAVIGDSTFVHTGIPGLINAAYNKTKGVILVLDNGTTAMTGSQHNPATGKTVTGLPTKQLSLEGIAQASGADTVDVIDPFYIKDLEALILKRLQENMLSVIIVRSPCRLIERTKHPMPQYKKELCKKCGLCIQIDCPALTKGEEGFVQLNAELCTGCNLCVDICPFGALVRYEK